MRINSKVYYEITIKEIFIMKTIIIRKPKFMRDDKLMEGHIAIAKGIAETIEQVGIVSAEMQGMFTEMNYHWNKAAQAGGFFRIEDFWRWMDEQKNNPEQ
jgi:hypothetical protein